MASILRVKDENGSIIDIPVLKGDQGEKGASVTVTSITQSAEDSGDNIVNFSDGKTVIIKNGSKGSRGEQGVGIRSIEKTANTDLAEIYTITLTNGETSQFIVNHGMGISRIYKSNTNNLVDTYTITLNNLDEYTFTVTNGKNGVNGVGITGFDYQETIEEDGVKKDVYYMYDTNDDYYEVHIPHGIDGLQGEKGDAGSAGKDGASVTVVSVEESTEDAGGNIVTFSDGKTITIKNGSKGEKGVDGSDYILTDTDKEEIAGLVNVDTDNIPDYWQDTLDAGAEAINNALTTAGYNKSAFLFYSDTHWNYGSQMSPKLLKYLYNHTGMTKTFFGGDIVNDEAADYDTMKYLWDWRNQLKDLPNHHSVVGNHDDGNSTNNLFSEQYVYGYLLSAEETPDIVRGNSGMYYYIDNSPEKTRYIFLDTAYKGITSDQTAFLKEALISTKEGWHIVVISHIWYMPDYDQYDVKPVPLTGLSSDASIVTAILDSYNSRSGEYAECGGWVEFCIGGHIHYDYDATTSTGIPIILVETDSQHTRGNYSYTVGTATEASVNGIIADYDNHKIYIVRIGRGESREIAVTNYQVTYTNVLSSALAADGTSVYNGTGYKADTRWSSSGNAEGTASGIYLTGYIPVSGGDIVRLKNITFPNTTSNTGIVHFFRSLTDIDEGNYNGTTLDSYNSPVWGANGNLEQFIVEEGFSYIRIQCGGIDETSIITINEAI